MRVSRDTIRHWEAKRNAERLAKQKVAEARLIAAAPDLLAALQRLVHPMADDTDLEHAQDVIARATGAA